MSQCWMLSSETVRKLLELPETGMGFQFVEGLVNGARKQLLIFNAEIAYDVSDLQLSDSDEPAAILLNGTRVVQDIAGAQVMQGNLSVSSLTVASPRVLGGGPAGHHTPLGPSAKLALPSSLVKSYSLAASRQFHRFSALNPDKRVNTTTGDFLAGTYATTHSDFPFAPSGFAAVGRYALPNILPASYHFQIEAPLGTQVTFGTVAPAYGQAGGGVEVLFVSAVKNSQHPPIWPPPLGDD